MYRLETGVPNKVIDLLNVNSKYVNFIILSVLMLSTDNDNYFWLPLENNYWVYVTI